MLRQEGEHTVLLAYSILLTINMLSILILLNNVLIVRVSVMVLNATFINIRDISERLVLLLKGTGRILLQSPLTL
jgi:hypothetical protein